MNHLEDLESKTIYILREAYQKFRNIAMLWSVGKDSTSLLWMLRKAFFGQIPFPIVHIDTGYKFKQIYEFRDKYAQEWNLDLRISQNEQARKNGMNPTDSKLQCCMALKTQALRQTLAQYHFEAVLLAIRRDEHGIRAKERYFSPRNLDFQWNYQSQPPELWELYSSNAASGEHFRIHPMLHWTEINIWEYIEAEKIPMVDLYFAKNGYRYRSIGCETCCTSVPSRANTVKQIIEELNTTNTAERSGRAQDKEDAYTMQKLRSLGYM